MDLIDREALIKQTAEKFYTTNYFKHITDMIDNSPTVDAIPMSVITEIKAEIIEMRKRDPLYYYVATEDILDWVLNTIDRKVKEHET